MKTEINLLFRKKKKKNTKRLNNKAHVAKSKCVVYVVYTLDEEEKENGFFLLVSTVVLVGNVFTSILRSKTFMHLIKKRIFFVKNVLISKIKYEIIILI